MKKKKLKPGPKKMPIELRRKTLGCKVAPETFPRLKHICAHGKQSQGRIIDELVEKRYNQTKHEQRNRKII